MTHRDVHLTRMFDDDPRLAAFARELADAAEASPAPAVGALLASVLEGAPPPPVAHLPRLPRRRTGRRVVIGAAVFGLGVGSLGVAGALPGPVQRSVARVGNAVGVDLPEGPDDTPATPPTTLPAIAPDTARAHVPTTIPAAPADHDDDEAGDDDPGRSEDRDEHADDAGHAGEIDEPRDEETTVEGDDGEDADTDDEQDDDDVIEDGERDRGDDDDGADAEDANRGNQDEPDGESLDGDQDGSVVNHPNG